MTTANESGGKAYREIMSPQPKWDECPVLNSDGLWCGRYVVGGRERDEQSPSVNVDAVKASGDRVPVKIDGVWYWVPPAIPQEDGAREGVARYDIYAVFEEMTTPRVCVTVTTVGEWVKHVDHLAKTASLQMQLDASCNAEELRQVRAERDALDVEVSELCATLEKARATGADREKTIEALAQIIAINSYDTEPGEVVYVAEEVLDAVSRGEVPGVGPDSWVKCRERMPERVALIVMGLRRELEGARNYIAELHRNLSDQTALKIAEKSFGYSEPMADNSWINADHLPLVQLSRHKKVNTEVLEVATYVAQEYVDTYRDTGNLENVVKRRMMSELFCRMQEIGLFRQFERKVAHETIYTIGIEVAKVRGE